LREKAPSLSNIGSIHYAQENYPEALKRYEEALQVFEQLGDLSEKATCLSNIARIHYERENFQDAFKRLEKALEIFIELGLEDSPVAQNIKKGIKLIRSKLSD